MNDEVSIAATGARTPVGLHAAPAAAAVRAEISGMKLHPFLTDQAGDLMPGAMDAQLDALTLGTERLLALAEPALREVCSCLTREHGTQLPLFLGLPELRPGFTEQDIRALERGLASFESLPGGDI